MHGVNSNIETHSHYIHHIIGMIGLYVTRIAWPNSVVRCMLYYVYMHAMSTDDACMHERLEAVKPGLMRETLH